MDGNHTLDQNKICEAMRLSFDHYNLHKQVVCMKLRHAKTATQINLKELNQAQDHSKNDVQNIIFWDIKKHDIIWDNIIDRFNNGFISTDVLEETDSILLRMPELIKKHYDALLSADTKLNALLNRLVEKKYLEAISFINDVQSKVPNIDNLGEF